MIPLATDPRAAGIPLTPADDAQGARPAAGQSRRAVDPKLVKAAQDFEAVFIRQLLKPLEKAGETGQGHAVASGSGVYGSMMVGAVADQASAGGGIGLAEMVLKALTDAGKATQKDVASAVPGSPIKLNKVEGL